MLAARRVLIALRLDQKNLQKVREENEHADLELLFTPFFHIIFVCEIFFLGRMNDGL